MQTFDNTVLFGITLTDQVLMFGGTINEFSELGRLPVFDWQLIFAEVTPLDVTPTILVRDTFPTEPIVAPQVYLELQTTPGFVTTLVLQLEPAKPTVFEVVTDAKLRIAALAEQGLLGAGVAQSVISKLDVVLHAVTTQRKGICGPLAGLRNQVGSLPRRKVEVALADELAALVAVLTEVVGPVGTSERLSATGQKRSHDHLRRRDESQSYTRLGSDPAWRRRVITKLLPQLASQNAQIMRVFLMGRPPQLPQ